MGDGDTTPPRLLRLIVPIKTINAVHYNDCLKSK